ncbi:MAG: sugar dehydrogenase complex small subunit [Duganella sp.]
MTTPSRISTSRRSALRLLGAVALSGVAGQLLLGTRARAALAAGAPGAGQDRAGFEHFLDVSKTLTGKAAPHAGLALVLYQALRANAPDFDTALQRLQAALSQGETLAQADKMAFSPEQKAEQALSQAILQAWYLGVVGKAAKAVCVAYTDTLSNQAVADVLVPPSFSYGPCGSWAAKP